MDRALYCPNLGYYEQDHRRIGRKGDFYTSVSVGSLFGQLLAFECARRVEAAGLQRFQLVEAGAHDGRLAADILGWLETHRPKLVEGLEYWLVEPSPRRRRWQEAMLDKFAGRTRWAEALEALPQDGVTGIIFSNELLDSFPLHRLGWDKAAQEWFEWGVALSGNQFVWERMVRQNHDWKTGLARAGIEFSDRLTAALPDGFIIDLCPAAGQWWCQAAEALRRGWLLTFDYGLTADQILAPHRERGTLRAFWRHRARLDALTDPGELDLTAHVNFTQLEQAGEAAGLITEGLYSQEQFLVRVAGAMWSENSGAEAPAPNQVRQFQSLTHPQHLGRTFLVLVQSRG